uniref:AlNc14C722G12444 protein n=1 Tax=Albugo laibachii Nc14 TaxID=890382 RepID=F0X1W7_9STRA|nr:AlNc14C722G12444 [Albugo laibachii Nc14]|eukprot:CCA27824.1 AlNc14C722G12444 [Albugo laibachii Nc14]
MLEELEGQNDLTLSLDGWEDRKGQTIFAFIASYRDLKQPFILDIVDLSSTRHTAENLKDQKVQVLQKLRIEVPATTYLRLSSYDRASMLRHAVNLLLSSNLRNSIAKNAMKESCRLNSYFNGSQYWYAAINFWGKSNGIDDKAEKFRETRWYSVVNVFRSVHEHEPAFRYCLKKNEVEDCPSIPQDIKDIIIDRAHFGNNEMCLKLSRIISDTIAESEKTAVTFADCFLRFLVINKATYPLDFPVLYGELKQLYLNTIQRRLENLAVSSELYNTKDAYAGISHFSPVYPGLPCPASKTTT